MPRTESASANLAHVRTAVCAFVGARRGIGTTTLAVNIGLALAQRGRDVVLLESPGCSAGAERLVPQLAAPDAVGARLVLDGDLRSTGLRRMALTGDPAARLAQANAARLDRRLPRGFTLFDVPADVLAEDRHLLGQLDTVAFVTTPEAAALADAYSSIKRVWLTGMLPKPALLVNFAAGAGDAARAARRLQRVAERFLGRSVANLGFVIRDTRVATAAANRDPLVLQAGSSPASSCINSICDRLCPAPPRRARRPAIWQKVASLFL